MRGNIFRDKRYITGPIGIQARPRVIVFDHLSAMHLGQTMLHDISLNVYEGESVAILGEPGAGKSMLLASIQGLVQPAQGHIHILGAEVPPVPSTIRRQIGVMPQHLNQPGKDTVADYLRHFAAMHEILLSQTQVNEYSHYYRLDPLSHISQLTALQLRILLLALGLVHDPRLVLLDEPLAGLSETGRPVIWQYIRRMQSEGRTLLMTFTSPLADEHLSGYDVIIELVHGRVVRQETGKG
jgi:ABC-2 type transport system ATP-binding protein